MTDNEDYGMLWYFLQRPINCLLFNTWVKQSPAFYCTPICWIQGLHKFNKFWDIFCESDAHCLLLEFSNTSGT